jgi:signal transduction histidine kinase
MTRSSYSDEPFARVSITLAMATVVISTFGWNVLVGPGPRGMMAILGALFLVAGTVGWVWSERRGPRAIAVWLCVLFLLTLPSLWLSQQGVMLIIMPVIGATVIYGSLRWGIVVSVLYLVFAIALNVHLGASPIQIYSASTGFIPGAVFTIVVGLLVVRERDTRRQLRRYAAQIEELATTRERNRIAREIHDSVGHYLTVVNVQIEAARATLARDPDASQECLVRARDFAREGLGELRRSVAMLRAGAVEQRPFGVALAELVAESRSQGLDTSLDISGLPRSLAPAVEFTLFRAAQEALTNVVRHASATQVRCTLRYDAHEVSLEVEDNGVGTEKAEGGFGLVGLRERVQLVGGSVRVKTSAGHGFTLEVRVPA